MIVGIIPARGGSKGIPRKNLKEICGKPLIAWTIEAGLNSNYIKELYVSTEDEEIAKVSSHYGAKVLFRPPDLAKDNSTTISALKYHLKNDIKQANIVVLLQCTSPIRDNELIDTSIQKFKDKGADCLATGFECKFEEWGSSSRPRQQIPGFFYDDGNVYVFDSELVKEGKIVGDKKETMIIDREQNIEIDDDFDFWLAEQVLLKRKNDKI